MGKIWYSGLGITIAVLVTLAVCGTLRLLSALTYKIGGIAVVVAIAALAYAIVRKRA